MSTARLRHLIKRYNDTTFTINRMLNALIQSCMPENLTPDQSMVLHYIAENKPCTSTELSEVFLVSKSSITAIITRLADKDFVKRTQDDKDRRVTYLSLTEKGEQMVEDIQQRIEQMLSKYLNQFERTEIENFLNTYEKLAAILVREQGGNETK